jgi:hypothetical protein
MANSSAISTSFKTEVLKAALYLASGSQGASTTAYSATNEVSGAGYTAGGVTVTNAVAPNSTGTTAFWTPSASFAWTTVTLATSFDAVTIYNSSQGNRAVSTHTFGAQTVTAANFTLTMPTNDATNGLIRLV